MRSFSEFGPKADHPYRLASLTVERADGWTIFALVVEVEGLRRGQRLGGRMVYRSDEDPELLSDALVGPVRKADNLSLDFQVAIDAGFHDWRRWRNRWRGVRFLYDEVEGW